MSSIVLFPVTPESAPYVLLGLRARWTCPDYRFVVRDRNACLDSNTPIGKGIIERIVTGETQGAVR